MQVKELQKFLEPLLLKVLDSVMQETGDDWGKCLTDVSVSHALTKMHKMICCSLQYPLCSLHVFRGGCMDRSHELA